MIGIYKITNRINQKAYIGQSVNIEKRWSRHKRSIQIQDYPLYRAMRKYGLEQFSFEVLEETLVSELDKRECYWIDFYQTALREKGYNLTLGGGGSGGQFLSLEDVLEIDDYLKNTFLNNQEIASIYGVSENTISGINTGLYWKRDIIYPIRKTFKKENNFCECGQPISYYAVKCIPCQAKSRRIIERPDKDTLFLEIREYGFTGTGRKYGVSDNAIRKWCKNYNMSTKIRDYKHSLGVD